jgi:hypothetical protein
MSIKSALFSFEIGAISSSPGDDIACAIQDFLFSWKNLHQAGKRQPHEPFRFQESKKALPSARKLSSFAGNARIRIKLLDG